MKNNTINITYHFLTLVNNKLKSFGIFSLLIFLFFIVFSHNAQSQTTLKKIVIDAGHGGKDPGASGKYSKEKDVVLNIALKTGQILKKKYPEVEIIYTRKTDIFIPLKERAEIANKNKADLFLSIHCNSNKSSQPHGSETYVMGLHKSAANLDVAKKENSAILFEDDYQQQYDGFDPTSEESHIIFNFFQNSFSTHNLDLASKMQTEFTVSTPLKNRGVKQAGFWVLYKTTMPGVLIEAGFLSNVNDEKFLNSKAGQLKLSQAIAKAVGDYKESHDSIEKDKIKHSSNTKPKEIVKEEKKQVKQDPISKPKKDKTSPIEKDNTIDPNKPVFKIQFLSLSTDKKLTGKKYNSLPEISNYEFKGLYRYTSGKTQNYDKAVKLQSQVRKAGFKDAFIIALYKGKRISLKEAKAKL